VHLNRTQFDIAIPGALATAMLTAAFFSLPLVVPVTVIGGIVTGILFAIRDTADS
jgi:hypothetical protein